MGLNLTEKPDFGGWATVYDVKCGDGRTLRKGAFSGQNGMRVPIVYNHDHKNLDSVLGHAYLEERDEGIYAYGYLNDSYEGQAAKERVKHGDIASLSIYANRLKEKAGDVYHGVIREVSLVLASANPKAYIDNVLMHSEDDAEDEWSAQMCFNEPIDTEFVLVHADDYDEDYQDDEEPEEEEDMATVGEIYDNMTEEQQAAVEEIVKGAVSQALDEYDAENQYDDDDEEYDEYDEGEEDDMRHNAFENYDDEFYGDDVHVLTHSEIEDMFSDAKTLGSLRASVLAHTDDYGIENIDYMFPDAKLNEGDPQFIKRPDTWVSKVMDGTSHSPFARIKSLFADITEDEARAKGYMKGNLKKEEVFTMLKRKTEPTTVYKKQKIDRDDVIDIKDFDVVAMLKREMREMLNEEIARAILVGDGRPNSSDDKIKEQNIRPIWKEEELFVVNKTVDVAANASADVKAKTFIRTAIKARKDYRGSGNPTLFCTEDLLTDMLLLEDNMGRPMYDTEEKLRTKLRVKEIVAVPVMEGLSRDDGKGNTRELMGIIVNLSDYKVGTDKGGEVNMFDDFDIDYNQQKYLIETRMSGALIKPFSAIVLEEAVSVTLSVAPTDPETTRYGKEVDDLQSNIQINEGSQQILGTLRYVTGYTGFSGDEELQSGNYLALDFTATPAEAKVYLEVIGGASEGNPIECDDGYCVFRIANKNQKIKVKTVNGDNVIERTYGLGSLKLKTAGTN